MVWIPHRGCRPIRVEATEGPDRRRLRLVEPYLLGVLAFLDPAPRLSEPASWATDLDATTWTRFSGVVAAFVQLDGMETGPDAVRHWGTTFGLRSLLDQLLGIDPERWPATLEHARVELDRALRNMPAEDRRYLKDVVVDDYHDIVAAIWDAPPEPGEWIGIGLERAPQVRWSIVEDRAVASADRAFSVVIHRRGPDFVSPRVAAALGSYNVAMHLGCEDDCVRSDDIYWLPPGPTNG
jgi:hypothetical protein